MPSLAGAAALLAASIASADVVTLTSGDTLTGTVVEQQAETLVFDHDSLGRLEIPMDQVAGTVIEDEGEADAPAPEVVEEPEVEKQWKSHFDLGASASAGNSDNQNLTVSITSERETEETRTRLRAAYFLSLSDGDRSENRLITTALHDWLIPDSRWLYFVTGRYDYDEFKSWEHRLGGHGGVGYELIKKEDFNLTLRAGLGGSKEWGSEDEDFRPEGLFGGNMKWQITERQSLEAASYIYPDLDDTGEFRTVSTANWSMLVDEDANMSLTAGLLHEYESQVDPGNEHYDLKVIAGLRFDF